MKKLAVTILLGFSTLLLTSHAQAGLIGDFIFIKHQYQNFGPLVTNASELTKVSNGLGDVVTFPWYQVNPENKSISVNFLLNNNWAPAATFNGLVVDGLDDEITDVTVDTNIPGWNNSRLSYTDDLIKFNWENLPFAQNYYFDASLKFKESSNNNGNGGNGNKNPNAVPEPATLVLLSSGLVGAYFRKKRI